MLRNPLAICIAVLLFLVGAVGAAAIGDESNPPSAGYPQVESIEPDAREAMSVLGEPRVASDGLPRGVAARMDARASFGMNPDLSRLSIGNATSSVYVIPANDHVCASLTVGEGASLICPSTSDVADGQAGPATVSIETGDIAIYGIVPDGVGSISIQAEGSAFDVETERNAYYTVVAAGTPLRAVSYEGPNGPVELQIHDPAVAFGE